MNIAVYCASSTKIHEDFFAAARALGHGLGSRGIGIVNGAGNMGLMAASADACLAAGGEVTGVIPSFMIEQGWHHQGLTHLIETRDMHERKETIARLSDGCIALPGGCGHHKCIDCGPAGRYVRQPQHPESFRTPISGRLLLRPRKLSTSCLLHRFGMPACASSQLYKKS